MKVFLSWSGEVSHSVALALQEWLPYVSNSLKPYVSSEDIDKGARWGTEISAELEACLFGVLCVTPSNLNAPWLNFEAGALSKQIDKSKVAPFLFGLRRSELISGPLLQFQSTIYDRTDIQKLVHSLNASDEESLIDNGRLDGAFDRWWPSLEERLGPLASEAEAEATLPQASPSSPNTESALDAILDVLQQQNRVINSPEVLLPIGYLRNVLGEIDRRERRPGVSRAALFELREKWTMIQGEVAKWKESSSLVPAGQVDELIAGLRRPIEYLLERE